MMANLDGGVLVYGELRISSKNFRSYMIRVPRQRNTKIIVFSDTGVDACAAGYVFCCLPPGVVEKIVPPGV